MGKIRIYELAKELGLENKDVIARAIELGLPDKTSHSNSLEPDEADQIRRAVIRQAIGVAPETKVVATRVDRTTGAARTVVESRMGNVIRRRKRTPEEEAAEAAAASGAVAEEVVAVPQTEEPRHEHVDPGHEEREAIFKRPAKKAVVEEKIEVEEVQEPVLEEPAVQHETAISGNLASERVPEVAAKAVEELEPDLAPATEEVKKPGPRVLGKISLPQKKAPVAKKPAATGAFVVSAAKAVDDEEEGEGGEGRHGKGADERKKRARKREFNVIDLVDYEGRPGARKPKAGGKKKAGKDGLPLGGGDVVQKVTKRAVKIDENITVGELARQMSLKAGDVIAKLIELGVLATINQVIDKDTATVIAEELGFEVESTSFNEASFLENEPVDDPALLEFRPPIVTVMGHVDHGKTTLLDSIRSASVAAKEHGGITQHIGAYSVKLENGKTIAFIDTPGHEAFTSMRARGAHVTDIVVLVVAADDGVMPQTIEAINHAKQAGVTIIVAINKIDKPGANLDRIKKQLAEQGLQPEDWGGDTIFYQVSALKGTGIKELLEGILLVAELKELKANPSKRAKGTVIEARQDRGRGTVATVLVQNGTLRVGDVFVTGSEWGRVRSMRDHVGATIEAAGPSIPVEITGLNGVPGAGDDFMVVESENDARQVAANRAEKNAVRERAAAAGPISLEEFARRASHVAALELNVILKADVHGSLEAVTQSLERLSTEKVKVKVIHSGVGGITESDVKLAAASRGIIVGFGVRAEPRVVADAESLGVELRFYRIIYELLDDIRSAMTGLLAPLRQESNLGRAEVREVFVIPKIGAVAGSYVQSGMIKRSGLVRLLRDNRVIHEGKILNLRRFKDDVREVQSGYECGISIENFNDIKTGDIMEIYEIKEVADTL